MTLVTALVKDPTGTPYVNAPVECSFVSNAAPGSNQYYSVGGSPFQQQASAVTDSFGNLTISLTGNDVITPAGSAWSFSVMNTARTVGFTTVITITGASQVVSAALQAAAATLPSLFGNVTVNNLTVSGNLLVGGPRPVFDVTQNGLICDGVTDNTTAGNALLVKANAVRGGATIFFPADTAGPCVFAGQLSLDNMTNVTFKGATSGWPGLAGGRILLNFTGATSPPFQLRNCFGCVIDGLYIQCANASGLTCVSFDGVAGGNGQSFGVDIRNSTFNGSNGNTAILLSLDSAVNTGIHNVSFQNAKVAVRGASGVASSFSNGIIIDDHTVFGSAGTCSISVADIQNAASTWHINGSTFELGNCSPGVQVIGTAGGFANTIQSINFSGNFIDDQSGANPTSSLFNILANGTASFTGNFIAPNSTNVTIWTLGAGASVDVGGNSFGSGALMNTVFNLGNNTAVSSHGNNWSQSTTIPTMFNTNGNVVSINADANLYPTVTTFLTNNPTNGRVVDSAGHTTIYQNAIAIDQDNGVNRTISLANPGATLFMLPANNAALVVGTSGTASQITTLRGGTVFPETTTPGCAASAAVLYADSTALALKACYHNTSFGQIPTAPTLLTSITAPTIAAAGCGGGAASIANNNGTAAFEINVGTTPGSACTVTMPAAAHGWSCSAVDVTTNSTSVFVQKQSPAASQTTTQIVITNFSDVAAATAFIASDVVRVSCLGY